MQAVLLSTAYFPPVSYFAEIVNASRVWMEAEENFPKQTYRNRCIICEANGPMNLVVPVQRGPEVKIKTKDIKLAWDKNWMTVHKRAIESAYRNSPFYEYYIDYLQPFFEKKHTYLMEYNHDMLCTLLKLIHLSVSVEFTTRFEHSPENMRDLRYEITPKKEPNNIHLPAYTQVFSEKFGFIPNLSILDLLFNVGPDSLAYLKRLTLFDHQANPL